MINPNSIPAFPIKNPSNDNKIYTYADYLNFTDDEPVEIIGVRISAMSPVPSRIHQEIIMEIAYEIKNYIKSNNSPCKIYLALFDVILKSHNKDVLYIKNIHI